MALSDSAWMIFFLVLPEFAMYGSISCGWTTYSDSPQWKWEWLARLAPVDAFLVIAIPVLLILLIILIARRGAGHPRAHQWSAFAAITLFVVDYLVMRASICVNPIPLGANCTADPATFSTLTWEQVTWAFAPAIFVVIGAAMGLRPMTASRRRP
ncbi:hypothetical protein [Acrocarpospora corrugata]|uniref:hypothetical protein n=1 Tax=Acrocarpospora corrugata TaxID=35763 RepID=UPI0014788CAC|nr:hypothetical protein [Acrocarpospora corrugata]